MEDDDLEGWTKFCEVMKPAGRDPDAVVTYGPGLPTEESLRLLGDIRGKRILELGCGAIQAGISFVAGGATCVAVDPVPAHVEEAGELSELHGLKLEMRQQEELADLAFLRPDTVDLALTIWALAFVEDPGRVIRAVHRTLRPGAPLYISIPHPALAMRDGGSYFDVDHVSHNTPLGVLDHHLITLGLLHRELTRASFRLDAIYEPEPDARVLEGERAKWGAELDRIPFSLIVRARKEGS